MKTIVIIVGVLCLGSSPVNTKSRKKTELTKTNLEGAQHFVSQAFPQYVRQQQVRAEYPCGPLAKSPQVPTSVHNLRPGDINIVGAMGDSISAGTGITAYTILGDLIQNRGLTWSGGGQTNFEDQITMPNIIKKYNPDLFGFATGNGDEDSRHSIFNVAVGGSTSDELKDQARKLIDRMKKNPNVDFDKDWKLVTILSGNNDLCDFCNRRDELNAVKFRENLEAALDILHAELPRTLVNLVEPLNMEIAIELNKGLLCSALHFFLCDCAAFPKGEEAVLELILEADLMQVAVEQIASSGRYDTREDFTVVAQPFFNQTYIPRMSDGEPDMTFFAPDCFHLSRKGQAAAASGLWNNMIEPNGRKRTEWSPGEPIECPSEAQPFIFTNKNGNSRHPLQERAKSTLGFQQTPEQNTDTERSSQTPAIVGGVAGVVLVAAVVVVVAVVIRRQYRRRYYEKLIL